jgi:hypothetical protein
MAIIDGIGGSSRSSSQQNEDNRRFQAGIDQKQNQINNINARMNYLKQQFKSMGCR